jgi:L-ribulose-5-phosphate 3-epimerase
MLINQTRRDFLRTSAQWAAGSAILGWTAGRLEAADTQPLYRISLAEYSLHRMIAAKELDPLDFAAYTKEQFGIDAVEYWNRPFFTKAADSAYIGEMKKRAEDAGVKSLLIMIDGEGNLGDPDDAARTKSVEKHYKWVEAAKQLDCHSIRVNAGSRGTYDEQLELAADGLRRLSEFAAPLNINVIVENHGGLSSNGAWLAAVMKKVDLKNCGTLPDFGNFGNYDRYQGVTELMPFAKAVSAKSHDFDDEGNETRTDYFRMMKIVVDAGYNGYVGIEYEGRKLSEPEGIRATQRLLERVRAELAKASG